VISIEETQSWDWEREEVGHKQRNEKNGIGSQGRVEVADKTLGLKKIRFCFHTMLFRRQDFLKVLVVFYTSNAKVF